MDTIKELMEKADRFIGELGHISILLEDLTENMEEPDDYDEMVDLLCVRCTITAIDKMFEELEKLDAF